jgi:uncharacterized protein (DUF1697 family)
MKNKHYYVALLRGINVGGNNKIPMKELKDCFVTAGFGDVTTYIQSGNVIFSSENPSAADLGAIIESSIKKTFGMNVAVVVIGHEQLARVIKNAPKNWGHDTDMKHNLLFVRLPYTASEAFEQMGTPKTEYEEASAGEGVVYWSASLKDFGKTASSKLASKPIYQHVTVRNYNTSAKLLSLLDGIARV